MSTIVFLGSQAINDQTVPLSPLLLPPVRIGRFLPPLADHPLADLGHGHGQVSGGKQYAKRATMWDAVFVGIGTMSRRDEGLASIIARCVQFKS